MTPAELAGLRRVAAYRGGLGEADCRHLFALVDQLITALGRSQTTGDVWRRLAHGERVYAELTDADVRPR